MTFEVIISKNTDLFHLKSFKNGIFEPSIPIILLKFSNIAKKLSGQDKNPDSFMRDFTV